MLVKQSSCLSRQYRIYLSTVQICVHQTVRLTTQFVGHKLCSQPDWLFGSIVRFQTSYVAVATPTHLFCSIAADGAESAFPSIANVRSFVGKHCVANAPDHTAQPAATSSPHCTVTKDVAMEYRRVVGKW